MKQSIGTAALDQLFDKARSYNSWQDKPVAHGLLKEIYDRMKMGPTSANCCPARLVFVQSQTAKEQLKPYISPGNVAKVMAAPVTVIIGQNLDFAASLTKLFPHDTTAVNWFDDVAVRDDTAYLN